jgi:hypothetical protein
MSGICNFEEVNLRHGILLVWSFIVMQRWWEPGRSCYEIALTVREAYSLVSEGVKLFRFQFLKTAFARIGIRDSGACYCVSYLHSMVSSFNDFDSEFRHY